MTAQEKELVILAADHQMKAGLDALLENRSTAIQMRRLDAGSWDSLVQPNFDAAVVALCHELLRSQSRRYRHALVVCDRRGSGREWRTRIEIESEIESNLARSGWENRSAAVVIDPELEIWAWSDSPHVDDILGWKGRHRPSLREWLEQERHVRPGEVKPADPQRAMDHALESAGKRRSSSIFQRLAKQVSLRRCQDPAFLKLCTVLRTWFPSRV